MIFEGAFIFHAFSREITSFLLKFLKSDNLIVQVFFFFIISYGVTAFKVLYFHFCNFMKKIKENEWDFENNFTRFYENITE